MKLLATPDFGATGFIMLCLGAVWLVVMALTLLGMWRGVQLLRSDGRERKQRGMVYLLASVVIPPSCWLGPSQLFRLVHGTYPVGGDARDKIHVGMTREEVISVLGAPHQTSQQEKREDWYYWCDACDLFWIGVEFRADGRVHGTYGN